MITFNHYLLPLSPAPRGTLPTRGALYFGRMAPGPRAGWAACESERLRLMGERISHPDERSIRWIRRLP